MLNKKQKWQVLKLHLDEIFRLKRFIYLCPLKF